MSGEGEVILVWVGNICLLKLILKISYDNVYVIIKGVIEGNVIF